MQQNGEEIYNPNQPLDHHALEIFLFVIGFVISQSEMASHYSFKLPLFSARTHAFPLKKRIFAKILSYMG